MADVQPKVTNAFDSCAGKVLVEEEVEHDNKEPCVVDDFGKTSVLNSVDLNKSVNSDVKTVKRHRRRRKYAKPVVFVKEGEVVFGPEPRPTAHTCSCMCGQSNRQSPRPFDPYPTKLF